MKILIIAVHHDPHSQAVCWGLRVLGHEPVVWYWENFPKNDTAGLRIGPTQRPSLHLTVDGTLHTEPFDVIWMRRKGTPSPMAGGHPDDTEIVESESLKYFENVVPFLGHDTTRWINHFDVTPQHMNKAHQLIVANALGFSIPDTLIGNDAQQVREFFAAHQGEIIHKAFAQVRWENEDGSRTIAKTSAITSEHLASDFVLRACPCIYQAHIKKKYELRVTVMGGIAIAAAIYSQQDGPTVDWRCEGGRGQSNLRAIALEPALHEKCIAVCRKLNITFGCVDLIVTENDEIVFLEVNSGGQFLFKEVSAPNIPMLDTFCRFLIHGDNAQQVQAKAQVENALHLTLANYHASNECREDRAAFAEHTRLTSAKKQKAN